MDFMFVFMLVFVVVDLLWMGAVVAVAYWWPERRF